MGRVDRQQHWQRIYTTKPADRLSWFQPEPTTSLRLIAAAGFTPDT